MPRVYVGIGSNIQPEANVRAGIGGLRAHFGSLRVSPVYRTAAVGFVADDFYNLVAAFDTELDVHAVVAVLREIEQRRGRARGGARFSSRTLDIDLLLYGEAVVEHPELCLPRPEITRYAFVLRPLADLAPSLRHPLLGVSVAELWAGFDAAEQAMVPVALEL